FSPLFTSRRSSVLPRRARSLPTTLKPRPRRLLLVLTAAARIHVPGGQRAVAPCRELPVPRRLRAPLPARARAAAPVLRDCLPHRLAAPARRRAADLFPGWSSCRCVACALGA